MSVVYADKGHTAMLGGPGAGKTTSLQQIAQWGLADWLSGKKGVPILVRLRDLRRGESLSSRILSQLGISVKAPDKPEGLQDQWELVCARRYVTSTSALLLVDGLDEVNPASRPLVEHDLRELALAAGDHRIVLTCRTAEYTVAIQNVQPYTILPLSDDQVLTFANRWLGPTTAPAFLTAIRSNPYAGAEVVPLTLAHLCAIYERDGDLPPRPIDVYEIIISLLIEQWDRQRGIVRASRYSDFSWRKKERFLQAIAFELTRRSCIGSFQRADLEQVYQRVAPAFGLPIDECDAVIDEVESHTGLVYQTGYRQYDFVHLVIQEFLTAMHAHRSANAVQLFVPAFPNEMALIVAYAPDAEEYLERVLRAVLRLPQEAQFAYATPFLSRLAIEVPTVEVSARSGWTVLAWTDLWLRWKPTAAENRFGEAANVARLTAIPAIAESIELAVREAERFDKGNLFLLVPKANASLAPWLRERLVAAKYGGLYQLKERESSLNRWVSSTRAV